MLAFDQHPAILRMVFLFWVAPFFRKHMKEDPYVQ
jgi:hypothetical protein